VETGGSDVRFETKLRGHRPSIFILLFVVWTALLSASGAVATGATRVLSFRHFSTGSRTFLEFVLSRKSYKHRVGRLKNPSRIFVDIPLGRLKAGFRLPRFGERSLAQKFRVGRPDRKRMRLVVELRHSGFRYDTFTLPGPDRIVVVLRDTRPARERMPMERSGTRDGFPPLWIQLKRQARRVEKKPPRKIPRSKKERRNSIQKIAARFRAGLGVIVLDPGHGGKDPGAIGLYGLNEKHLALDISRRITRSLRKILPPGVNGDKNKVFLTRTRDRYISLNERTAFANKHDADVFISIHANSSPIKSTRGIETYFLAEASTERALKLAARESGTTVSRLSDVDKIKHDLRFNTKMRESPQLAKIIQSALLSRLTRKYSNIKDLGVKRGPFYVLAGAANASILIELGFLSNRLEARRLRAPKFRENIAEGIATGILRFIGVYPQRASILRR